ncbi:formate dehydrogenase accessory sulfurtransferase FdhD [Roseomonas sp. OT10]|uniref:formate dehydrogenase accessory sulfurtransferase FdhD n=1 Tax=Roseomonas cutis TaxID=2897332 RepID=UPI001E6199F2|nr:formate dehydrogenase accessory sulfurtransferase FdhD [Roseomonas sp. OT10]UFN47757.1 formate dehydrogenase accessory sulfurtransferase FdhD [Roseomonas sp. OT10]
MDQHAVPEQAFRRVEDRLAWRRGAWSAGRRDLPAEVAVAFTYNRLSHAVMMATPADLEDFATGFSLAEGIVRRPAEIEELEVVPAPKGVELRMWIREERMGVLEARRRRMAGPTGCGLCGLESLAAAFPELAAAPAGPRVTAEEVAAAMASLAPAQRLNRVTRAVHAAGLWLPEAGLVALREDVGRHNALDKLAGAAARGGHDAGKGIVVMTSRVSVELVQKATAMGAAVLAAVSAPTGLALELAEAAGLTLIGIAREDGFEVFTHPGRVAR